jgi:hypothetical protein
MLLIIRKFTSAELYIDENAVAKNDIFDVKLFVKNRCIFPVSKAEAIIEYYNVFNNQINDIELHFPIQARNSHCLSFQLSSKFCGIIKLKCTCIKIYDPLRIFKFKICKNLTACIVVLPEGHRIHAYLSSNDRLNDESSIYSEIKPGDDSSEVLDLRSYNPGDRLNRIHWKLSCKKDDLIVKELSLPIDSPTIVFLNLHCPEDSEYTLPMYDTLLEALVSVSQFLIENERVHTIVYYNAAERQFTKRLIDSENALSSAVYELIMSIRDDLSEEVPETFFYNGCDDGFASLTFITAEQNEDLLTFIDEETDADIKNAVIIKKNADESACNSGIYSRLNVHSVVIGKIASSIHDMEL